MRWARAFNERVLANWFLLLLFLPPLVGLPLIILTLPVAWVLDVVVTVGQWLEGNLSTIPKES